MASSTSSLTQGQLASFGQEYTPFVALSRFPYKFIGRDYSERVADEFFNGGKLYDWSWDLFYVWPPANVSDVPLILVTANQFRDLLNKINSEFEHLGLGITQYYRDIGMVFALPEEPAMTPRFLGQSGSREQFERLVTECPRRGYTAKNEPKSCGPSDRSFEAFQAMMELAIEQTKKKNTAAKAKKKEDRLLKQRGMRRQLKRTQAHLGLRPTLDHIKDPKSSPEWPTLSPQSQAVALEEFRVATAVEPIDINKTVVFPFEDSVIFIAIDVEAYERNHNMVTEVGLAFLDTKDIMALAPGKDGVSWTSKIRAYHYRIKEHMHYTNGEYVAGCADRFEFGKSEIVSLHDIATRLATCFNPPFVADKHDVTDAMGHLSVNESTVPGPVHASSSELPASRKVILVGHDINQDIKYLHQLGYSPLNSPCVVEKVDTADLWKVWKRESQSRALGSILHDFGQTAWNVHNAGNDACYTLQAMLAITVRDAEMRGSAALAQEREATQAGKLEKAAKEAAERVLEEAAGWESDGGVKL